MLARAIFHEKNLGAAGNGAVIVNVGTADVATIARIAAADYPRLVEVGTRSARAPTRGLSCTSTSCSAWSTSARHAADDIGSP